MFDFIFADFAGLFLFLMKQSTTDLIILRQNIIMLLSIYFFFISLVFSKFDWLLSAEIKKKLKYVRETKFKIDLDQFF